MCTLVSYIGVTSLGVFSQVTPLVKCITTRKTPFVRYVYVRYITMRMTLC